MGSTALLYHSSAAMEVSGFFEFDAVRGVGRELEPGAGSIALDSDMTADGSWLAYVDNPSDVTIVSVEPFHGIITKPLVLKKVPDNDIIRAAAQATSAKALLDFARQAIVAALRRSRLS